MGGVLPGDLGQPTAGGQAALEQGEVAGAVLTLPADLTDDATTRRSRRVRPPVLQGVVGVALDARSAPTS